MKEAASIYYYRLTRNMLREAREELGKMRSLMERMGQHYTADQAKLNKRQMVCEALNGGHLKPEAHVEVIEDNANRMRILRIKVYPMYPQDQKAILKYYLGDAKVQPIKVNGMDGISIYRNIPFGKKRGNDAQKPDASATPKADVAADTSAQSAPAPKKGGLLGMLNAKKNGVNESLMGMLNAKKNGGAKSAQTAAPAQGGQQASPAQPTQAKNEVFGWLKDVYGKIPEILSKNPNYDKKAISDLQDFDDLYSVYMSTPTEEDKLYPEKNSETIKKELTQAIKSGKWQDVLRNSINPLNLESIVFGNILSLRNQHAVQGKAQEYGTNPTLIFAPGVWSKRFGRRVRDNANPYPISVPRIGSGHDNNVGTKAHQVAFHDPTLAQQKGFQVVNGYDYADTDPIDPNNVTDYITGTNPGIVNNLTGELNQAAKDFKANLKNKVEASLTPEQKKSLAEVQTLDGQARIFNEALMAYDGGKTVKDISNDPNPVVAYARNILAMAESQVSQMGYANPTIKGPMSTIIAFAIGCYTLGSDQVLQLGSGSNLKADFSNYIDSVISIIRNTSNYIFSYLNSKYAAMAGSNIAAQSDALQQQANAAAQPQAKQAVSESVTDRLESLLEDF